MTETSRKSPGRAAKGTAKENIRETSFATREVIARNTDLALKLAPAYLDSYQRVATSFAEMWEQVGRSMTQISQPLAQFPQAVGDSFTRVPQAMGESFTRVPQVLGQSMTQVPQVVTTITGAQAKFFREASGTGLRTTRELLK